MSTILKALRRLEEDRSAHAARPLREEVASGETSERGGRGLGWLVFGALAVGVGVGAAALTFLSASRQNPTTASPARSPVVQAPAPAPARAVRVARAPSAPPAEPSPPPVVVAEPVAEPSPDLPPAALASTVERVKRPAAEPRIADPVPPHPTSRRAAAVPPEPAPAPGPDLEEPAPPAPVTSVVARVSEVEAPAPPVAPPAPAFAERPRAEVPAVRVERTSWHPSAERRSARIELIGGGTREIREGDAVGPLVVTTIEPSGVVFEHEGIEIRRRVGAE